MLNVVLPQQSRCSLASVVGRPVLAVRVNLCMPIKVSQEWLSHKVPAED